ncbi:nucleoside hydrolase [Cnuella takakiae]|nr:nucleoside hydrolase [Cnuella takakiae]
MKKIFLLFALAACSLRGAAQAQPVIFDSDMGPDYDDVGAIAMLHAYADSGYIDILATVASTRYPGVAGVFEILNTYFNRPQLPIGVPHTSGLELRDRQHWSDSLLAQYPHRIQNNKEVPEAVAVYRKLLAAQPDTSVVIITVGFLTNLADLLRSGPDQYSKLDGATLVRSKVKKLVSMAGIFPKGKEFNVEKDAAASQYVFSRWPTDVVLSGFEIGKEIKVGVPLVRNVQIRNSPVKDVFRIAIPMDPQDSAGRMSWDETAVLVAAKGAAPWYRLERGTMTVAADGSNGWQEGSGKHFKMVAVAPPKVVEQLIEKAITHQPVK